MLTLFGFFGGYAPAEGTTINVKVSLFVDIFLYRHKTSEFVDVIT